MEGFADIAVAETRSEGNTDTTVTKSTDAAGSSQAGKATEPEPTLEEEVKQLVGSVSSWWTDFSKRSQEQINAARKEIESQGGIVSIAKKEAQKFEAQLSNAQKSAREKAQAVDGESNVGDVSTESIDKGKSRQSVEGDDGVAVDNLEEKAKRKSRSDSRSEVPVVSSTGEAIFDVDGPITDQEKEVLDQKMAAAKANAQVALQNVQSFWDRLQADPRLNNIQASLASTLKNVSLPKAASNVKEESTEDSQDSTKVQSLNFADVSKQFQASFPHLNWKESQALAKKYYDASENVARDWGKEMTTLMGDLVKIVPPDGSAEKGSAAVSQPNAATTTQPIEKPVMMATTTTKDTLATGASTEDEDFDWDGDMDSSAASTGLQTTSGPPTTNWEGSGSDHESATVADNKVKPTADAKKATSTTAAVDDEEESDWE